MNGLALAPFDPIATPPWTLSACRLDAGARIARRTRANMRSMVRSRLVSARPDDDPIADALRRAAAGDQPAFAEFYDHVSGTVYGTVLKVLRDPAMSEEVTQEVFVELWQTAPRFDRERASLATWATTLARRRAIDRVRREQSQRDRLEEAGAQRTIDDDGTEDGAVSSIEASRVRAAVATLPDDQREAITMSFIEGHAHGEIARRLDLPLGTVKGRVRGGLRKLRDRLDDGA